MGYWYKIVNCNDIGVIDITEKQKDFFNILKKIQDKAVVFALSERKEKDSIEDTLYSATYDVLYGFLELIDGYATDVIKLDLIDKETGISIRKNIELHDVCANYLRYSYHESNE